MEMVAKSLRGAATGLLVGVIGSREMQRGAGVACFVCALVADRILGLLRS